jgi:class 3 adenylate cyclase
VTAPLDAFLASLDLERYTELFVENEVDLDTLRILTEADLEELGVPFGPRKKLLTVLAAGRTGRGDPLPGAQRERRHVTALFSDMVDFTVLASRLDPEELESVIKAYEEVCGAAIASYEGYVYNRLGDGIIAFFGFPLAQERSAERAIRTSLEIIERLEGLHVPAVGRIQARVGLAAGVVLVSPADKGATGITMNLAARLQTAAAPGQVAVSSRVQQLAGPVFDYRDLGELQLKGISEPVRAYVVEGVRRHEPGDPAVGASPAVLVGRERELAMLRRGWESAQRGLGGVACVVGEAGIGKSRIVAALCQNVAAAGVDPMVIQCSPYHEHSAYYPFADALRRLLDIGPETVPEAAIESLVAMCERLGCDDHARFLARVMGLPDEQRFGRLDLAPRDEKERTVAALVALVHAVARQGPTLAVVEDLHWADPSTLDTLDALVGGIHETPILMVTTQRPEAALRWSDQPTATLVEIGRFSDAEAHALVVRLADGSLTPETATAIVGRADGIPLFLEELTAAVQESGSTGERWAAGAGAAAPLPHTLRDLLAVRLDRLGEAKEIAQLGAVIGRDFSHDLLRVVADQSDEMLEDRLDQLCRTGLAVAHPDGAWYTFKHALVRDAAYESLTVSRRRELHGRIADQLDGSPFVPPELIARHLTAAGRSGEAVDRWCEAGQVALARFALAEAVAHYGAGLDLIPELLPGAAREMLELQLRSEMAPAFVAIRGWAAPEVGTLLAPAVPLARAHHASDRMLPVLHGLWVHHMSAAQHQVALGWAEEQLAAARETGDEVLELNGHRSLMTSHFWLGDLPASLEHGDHIRSRYDAERHHHIAELTNADPYTAEGSYRCQALWILGRPDLAREVSDEKDAFARRRKHPFDLCFALTIGALTFDYRGEPDELLARAEEAIRVGRVHRVPLMSETMAQILVGIAWLRSGRVGESVDQISHSLTALRATGHRAWVPYVHAVLGEALALGGDLPVGLEQTGKAISLMETHGELVHLPEALRLDGWIRSQLGDADRAQHRLQQSLDLARRQGARSWELRTSTTLAELLVERGDRVAADALLRPLIEGFTEGAGTADHRRAAKLLARAAQLGTADTAH